MFKVSFAVDDKKLGDVYRDLAKIGVIDLTSVYMINAQVVGGELKPKHGSAGEAFVAEVNKRKLDQVNPRMAREIVAAIGFKPTSYFHILESAIEQGLMHRGPKDGTGYLYVVTRRLPAPPKKGGK